MALREKVRKSEKMRWMKGELNEWLHLSYEPMKRV